jgi:hypothetical protein
MEDDDVKMRARPNETAFKPGAVSVGDEGTKKDSADEMTAMDAPESLRRLEQDSLSKQRAMGSTTAAPFKPGAVSIAGTNAASVDMPPTTRQPGVTHEEPSSRLAAKLRGEMPVNWSATAPAVSTLQSREDKIQSKIRDVDHPPVNPTLMGREDQIQEKIRGSDNTTSTSIPGALSRLTTLEDAVTSKQGTSGDLSSNIAVAPMVLQRREDVVATKNRQINETLNGTPQRLQQAEDSLTSKMRDGTINNANISNKLAGDDAIEYGEMGGPNDTDLAVAVAVEEDIEDTYLPAAVEYDPDAKPPLHRSHRFRMYTCLAIVALIVGIVGAVVGIVLTTEGDDLPAIHYRATLGIRENIELVVSNKEQLVDTSSPYRKALDWIMFNDPMLLTPESPKFLQRYIAAYFFYATSMKKTWTFDCNPPQVGEMDSCTYDYLEKETVTSPKRAERWLTNTNECDWAGVTCDETLHIRGFDLST